MKRATFLALVVALVPLAAAAQNPTILLLNGKVFTGDAAQPFVEAVAITGERITAVGTTDAIRRLGGNGAGVRTINLRGRTVIPGINDAHLHPGDALTAFRPDIGMDPTWAQVASAITAAVDETAADVPIIISVGNRVLGDRNVTRVNLDAAAPNRRVLLRSFTGHGIIMSSAAMEWLGVPADAADPSGGSFGRDANGGLNGRAYEYAQYAIDRRLFDSAGDAELLQAVSDFGYTLAQYGITSIQAMPVVSEARFLKAWELTGIPVRLRVIAFPMELEEPLAARTSGVKWILDGTPIERGAALRTLEYANGSRGRLNFTDIRPLITVTTKANQQLLVHAAGDGAVEQALRTILRLTEPLKRPRIEHGDGLQGELIEAAKRTGAVVVQNPAHFQFLKAYPDGQYMLAKTLVNAQIPLAFGSDGPLNPFLNIMLAVQHPDDAEKLTREQAVIAYTSMSAYAEFAETEKGKIVPGMLADIAVLSQDIFTVPLGSLPDTTSVLTIINGKVVHGQL
jgi:predicted amidohydrolase YtcJ